MKLKKIYSAFSALLAIILAVTFQVPAFALTTDQIDMDQKGNIHITVEFQGEPVAGEAFRLIKVADIKTEGEQTGYTFTDEFMKFDGSLENVGESNAAVSLAKTLKDYVKDNNVQGDIKYAGEDGKIAYTNLELGLYLVIQEDKPDGYVDINPFLVSVPDEIEGKIAYDVDASPKIDVYRKNSQTDKIIETTTVTSDEMTPTPKISFNVWTVSTRNVTSDEMTPTPKIPQTGLLAWPVILFTLIGVLLVAFGIMFRTTSKDNHKSGADEA